MGHNFINNLERGYPDNLAAKQKFLKSVSDHFIQEELNRTLEIKTTIE